MILDCHKQRHWLVSTIVTKSEAASPATGPDSILHTASSGQNLWGLYRYRSKSIRSVPMTAWTHLEGAPAVSGNAWLLACRLLLPPGHTGHELSDHCRNRLYAERLGWIRSVSQTFRFSLSSNTFALWMDLPGFNVPKDLHKTVCRPMLFHGLSYRSWVCSCLYSSEVLIVITASQKRPRMTVCFPSEILRRGMQVQKISYRMSLGARTASP